MRLKTTGRKELIRWVLSWMPDVKVLTPKSLRDRIKEKGRDGLSRKIGSNANFNKRLQRAKPLSRGVRSKIGDRPQPRVVMP